MARGGDLLMAKTKTAAEPRRRPFRVEEHRECIRILTGVEIQLESAMQLLAQWPENHPLKGKANALHGRWALEQAATEKGH